MRWFILVGLALTISAFAEDVQPALTKEQKLKALREALRSPAPSSKKSSSGAKTNESVDLVQSATQELQTVPAARQAKTNEATARPSGLATVQTSTLVSEDPRTFRGLQLGLTAQPFSASGKINLVGIGERDLSSLPTAPMLGLELRYAALPFTVRAFANFASQPVRWSGPTGKDLGESRLNALQTGLFLGQEKHFGRWNLLGDLGLSRFDLVQTGVSNLTEISGGRWLLAARLGVAYPIGAISFSASYEHRVPLGASWVQVSDGAWLLGVHYGLR